MKLLNILLKPIRFSEKAAVIFGAVFLTLFVSASVFMTLFFELPLTAVIAALAVLSFAFFKMKLHTLIVKLPVIYHITAALVFAYMAHGFYRYTDGSTLYMAASSAACGMVVFAIAEIVSAVLLGFLSDGPHPRNFLWALASVFPLLFTTIVYVPSETYFTNQKDFLFVYFDFAQNKYVEAAVLILIVSLCACVLKEKAFRVFTALCVGLTLCVYCQYVFMNGDLPASFGDPVDWDSLLAKKIVNAVIWCVLLFLPLLYVFISGKIKAAAKIAAVRNAHVLAGVFIGGVQLISLIVMIVSSEHSLFTHERYRLEGSEQYVVSSEKNVITFIIDTADRHYFDDAYEQDPEKFAFLKDFTYYTNACMMYDSTYLSIPQMLSGTAQLPENDIYKWLDETWSSEPCETFYSRLHEENYKVNVFGDFSYDYSAFAGKIDNCVFQEDRETSVNYESLFMNINALSAFRYMPLAFKQDYYEKVDGLDHILLNGSSCKTDNSEFLSGLDLKCADTTQNCFIVQHIMGAHEHTSLPVPERVSICLDILKEYTDQLKEMGLYDDAVIIVTADHGEHLKPNNTPIWYIKPAGAHNDEMQYSAAPIHHSDYLATVIEAAGLKRESDGDLFGRSIFDIPEDEQRERLMFQRYGFKYAGEIDFKRCTDRNHLGAAYGYYFTGDREDLVRREEKGPPDVLLELKEAY